MLHSEYEAVIALARSEDNCESIELTVISSTREFCCDLTVRPSVIMDNACSCPSGELRVRRCNAANQLDREAFSALASKRGSILSFARARSMTERLCNTP